MAGLGSTTLDLNRLRKRLRETLGPGLARHPAGGDAGSSRGGSPIREVTGFGSNPGNLRMFTFVPSEPTPAPALVLVLHGCTQNAAGYDIGAGWSTLAERHGFALVFAEQSSANNQNACFNWFVPGDTRRGGGEALSISQMVDHAAAEHGVDRSRVFVTGLSAGGAMAAVMLATYPELFAGGGIIAGLPYGAAGNLQEALRAMYEAPDRPARDWGQLVRDASPGTTSWPRLSVWHGGADAVVRPANARHIVAQWADLHGVSPDRSERQQLAGQSREVWRGPDGREVIESITVAGMGHGTPLKTDGPGATGRAGPFMLDVGLSSSEHLIRFWGLANEGAVRTEAPGPSGASEAPGLPAAHVFDGTVLPPQGSGSAEPAGGDTRPEGSIEAVINGALRAAGLLRK